jgi:hypothetical protein
MRTGRPLLLELAGELKATRGEQEVLSEALIAIIPSVDAQALAAALPRERDADLVGQQYLAERMIRSWADGAGPSWVRTLVNAGYGGALNALETVQQHAEAHARKIRSALDSAEQQKASFDEPSLPKRLASLSRQLGPPFALALVDERCLTGWRAVSPNQPVPLQMESMRTLFKWNSNDSTLRNALQGLLNEYNLASLGCRRHIKVAFDHGSRADKDGMPHADRLVAAIQAYGEPIDGLPTASITPERTRQLLASLAQEADACSRLANADKDSRTATKRRLKLAPDKLRSPQASTVQQVLALLLARAAPAVAAVAAQAPPHALPLADAAPALAQPAAAEQALPVAEPAGAALALPAPAEPAAPLAAIDAPVVAVPAPPHAPPLADAAAALAQPAAAEQALPLAVAAGAALALPAPVALAAPRAANDAESLVRVKAAVDEVLRSKLRGRMRTDCERCARGFAQPDLLRRYAEVGNRGNPEAKQCCFLEEHAYSLKALADEVLSVKETELLQTTSLKKNHHELHTAVQGEVLKLVQTECGIGLLGTPTVPTSAKKKQRMSDGSGIDTGKSEHRVTLYSLVRGDSGTCKIAASQKRHVNVFMGLRPSSTSTSADGGSTSASASASASASLQ